MTGVVIALVVYQLAIIFGVAWWISKEKKKGEDSFMLSNRDLPVAVVGVTLALTVLGSAHVFGLMENAYAMGAVSLWFSFAHVILLTIICLVTGRWVRRFRVGTVPEMIEKLYDNKWIRVAVACAQAGMVFGLLTMETQALGVGFAALTGWKIQQGCILGGILGMLYVLFAGMEEIGWVNLINAMIMYTGVVVAAIFLGFALPGHSWASVNQHFINTNQEWMLSIFGTPKLLMGFGLAVVLSTILAQSVSQMALQTAMSAKNEQTVKKALWIAAPLNGMFGVFTCAFGLAALSIPKFAALGPKLAGPTMLVALLPKWLVAWLWAGFNAALLSTFAMNAMAPATVFVKDIYVRMYKPNATDEEQTKLARIAIVILSLVAIVTAAQLPPMVAGLMWLFAWLVPVCFIIICGMFWKRSNAAALVTLLLAWLVNCLWSFTSLPQALHISLDNVYITLTVSLVVGIVMNLVCKGKPGFFREKKAVSAQAA